MELKQCKQCGLPQMLIQANKLPLQFDQDGVCIYCQDYNKYREIYHINYKQKLIQFNKLINERKGQGKYDVVLMFTGGKDSCYSLYLLAKEYKLKVLAVSWDNGFFGKEHRANLEKFPKQMGIDHKIVSLDKELMSEFYRNRIRNFGRFCGCLAPAFLSLSPVIAESETSLIMSAVSFGQTISKLQNTSLFGVPPGQKESVLKDLMENFGFTPVSSEQFNLSLLLDFVIGTFSDKAIQHFSHCIEALNTLHDRDAILVNLPCIFEWDLKTVLDKVRSLGWNKPADALDIGHTSCKVELMKGYVAYKQNVLNTDINELAAELRFGHITRDEYYQKFSTTGYSECTPEALDCCLNASNITREEFFSILQQSPLSKKELPPVNDEIVKRLPIRIPDKIILTEKLNNYYQTAIIG